MEGVKLVATDSDPITLTRHLLTEQRQHAPDATGEFSMILNSL
jgi:fructose-1,6-bisphosphatase I